MATIYYLLLIRLSVKVNWDTELNQGLRHRCYFYRKIYYRSDLIALIFYFAIKTHTKRLTIKNDRKINVKPGGLASIILFFALDSLYSV